MKSMVHIGPDVEKLAKTLPDITKALMAIVMSPAGDDVKKSAMTALSQAFSVNGTTVSNCHFENRGSDDE